jgi:transcriptional repressor NrdR
LNCPFCSANDDKVIDSRESDGGKIIRRRRECLRCGKRFTTYERFEQTARLVVIKRDGTRVPFSRDNIMKGVQAACGKRPIPEEAKEALVDQVDEELHRQFDREVESRIIGERVMAKLHELDEVAYIRFASEYFQFQNMGELRRHVDEMAARPKDVKEQQRLFGAT